MKGISIMKLNIIYKNARCAVAECIDGSIFQLGKKYDVYVNGVKTKETDRVIFSLYGLKPQTMYTVEIKDGEETAAWAVRSLRRNRGWQEQQPVGPGTVRSISLVEDKNE